MRAVNIHTLNVKVVHISSMAGANVVTDKADNLLSFLCFKTSSPLTQVYFTLCLRNDLVFQVARRVLQIWQKIMRDAPSKLCTPTALSCGIFHEIAFFSKFQLFYIHWKIIMESLCRHKVCYCQFIFHEMAAFTNLKILCTMR